jgi:hypothetical protein
VAHDSAVTYFPYLIARGDGQLAASWFTGTGNATVASVAYIETAGEGAPRVARAPAFQPEAFQAGMPPDTATSRSAAGEYLGMSFLADGSLGVAVPIQHAAAQARWLRLPPIRGAALGGLATNEPGGSAIALPPGSCPRSRAIFARPSECATPS